LKNQHKYIKKFLVAVSLSLAVVSSVFAIEEKDYKSMTDRDRILLSVSYYEVSMKYEALNNKALANSYRKEALKIEPNVVKYYSGEWEVPKKTIEIDWNSIFADETTDEDESQDVDVDVDIEEDDTGEITDESDDIDDDYLDSLLNGEEEPVTTEDDIDDDELLDLLDDEENNDEDETDDTAAEENNNDENEAVKEKDTEDKTESEEAVNQAKPQNEESDSAQESDKNNADNEIQTDEHQTPQSDEDSINEDSEESDNDWIPGQTSDADVAIMFSQIVRGFIDGINDGNPDKAVKDFAENVKLNSIYNMKKEELRDTITVWLSEHDEQIPDYTDISIMEDVTDDYEIGVLFDKDFDFFMPMNEKKLVLRVQKTDGYKITELKVAAEQTAPSGEANSDAKDGYMYRFISMVINGEYEFVAALLSKDIWISEFNMLFPASEIIDHLQNWALDNENVKDPAEVIDVSSIVEGNDAALAMIQSMGMAADDYDIISFRLLNKTFLPGDPNNDVYTVVVGKSGEAEGRIAAIIQ